MKSGNIAGSELRHRALAMAGGFASAYAVPGLAFGLLGSDGVRISDGVGRLGGKGKPVGDTSVFHAASLSKITTALLVAMLNYRGALDLDHPVMQVLKGSLLASSPFGCVTLRQILSHTAGFPDVEDYAWGNTVADDGALGRYVETCAGSIPLFSPGCGFSYSNMGFEVAGHAASVVGNATFEDLACIYVSEPLGMNDSTYFQPAVPASRAALPHVLGARVRQHTPFPYNRVHAPSSTLQTTAVDLLRLAEYFITSPAAGCDASPGNGNRLPPEVAHEMIKPVAVTGKTGALVQYVGLAWFMGTHRGVDTISHSGNDSGFSSFIVVLPDKGIAACALANLSPAPVGQLCLGLLDLALGMEEVRFRKPALLDCLDRIPEMGTSGFSRRFYELSLAGAFNEKAETDYLVAVAGSMAEAGDARLAIEILEHGIDACPEDSAMYEVLAKACFFAGDMSRAADSAMRSLAIKPDNPVLRARVSALEGRKDLA